MISLQAWLDDHFGPLRDHRLIPSESLPVSASSGPARWRINDAGAVVIDPAHRTDEPRLRDQLLALNPWRKGPWRIGSVDVVAEWHSPIKLARLMPLLKQIQFHSVVDLGGGNGFYGFHWLNQGAEAVWIVDPNPVAQRQALAVSQFAHEPRLCFTRGKEALLGAISRADLIVCAGVAYHHREPVALLSKCAEILHPPQGWLLLETIVVQAEPLTLDNTSRYAGMRNVFTIPNRDLVVDWANQAGFRLASESEPWQTTFLEQRRTTWSPGYSLAEFLDPKDPGLTREGWPGPLRQAFLFQKRSNPA